MSKHNMFFALIFSWFGDGFLGFFSRFFETKSTSKLRKRIFKKAYETLPMATKSRVGVLKELEKINKYYNKFAFFLTSILEAFWNGFGRVLGA